MTRQRRKWLLLLVVTLGALAADLLTKSMVTASLPLGERRELLPLLSLQHVQNRGVAFGLFSGGGSLIALVAVAAIGVMLVYVFLEPRPLAAGLGGGLLLGGSLGNLVERITLGYVTDFLELPRWPNFNLADVFIVLGVAVIAAYMIADLVRTPPTSD